REAMTIYANALVALAYSGFKISKNRIVFEQMRKSAGVGNVVDGYDFYVLTAHRSPINIPANAAKTVNADPGCHLIFLHDTSDVAIPRLSTFLGDPALGANLRHKREFRQVAIQLLKTSH